VVILKPVEDPVGGGPGDLGSLLQFVAVEFFPMPERLQQHCIEGKLLAGHALEAIHRPYCTYEHLEFQGQRHDAGLSDLSPSW